MNQPIETDRDSKEIRYPRRIIVKFVDKIGIPYEDGAENHLPDEWMDDWKQVQDIYPGATLKRLYRTVSADRLQELKEKAQDTDKLYRPVDFLTFFYIHLDSEEAAASIVKVLSESKKFIDYVYQESLPAPNPDVPQGANPALNLQGYAKASNFSNSTATSIGGIDTEAAWLIPGAIGSGTGISFIDIEMQWDLNHNEWADSSGTVRFNAGSLIHGHNYSEPGNLDPDHGTKVLGILGMQDNAVGGVGLARDATGKLVSVWRDAEPGESTGSASYIHDIPQAIMTAIDHLAFGDVLLIERQIYAQGTNTILHPVEMDPAIFAEIRLATALGIAVIEPAGNMAPTGAATVNLDTQVNYLGRRILERSNASGLNQFEDSGAIMVAAAYSSPTSVPGYLKAVTNRGYWSVNSNSGSRVDCFAWGDNVRTTSAGNNFVSTFGGTSAAAAIVAGAAIVVQSLAKQNLSVPFNAWHLRHVLTSTGTLPAADNPAANPIGVMPNLNTFISAALNATPDLVVRDNLSDNGTIHSGTLSTSPDIIVRPENSVANPQAAFGGGNPNMGNANLGTNEITRQDQDIFVRVFNRGGSNATNAQATVYWSPPSTLVTPNMWNLIGTSTPLAAAIMPNPSSMTVLNRVNWDSSLASFPGPGHYCFIAVVHSAQDPNPIPDHTEITRQLTFDEFRDLIRTHNNIAWRNFNIGPLPPSGSNMMMSFVAPGAFDEDRAMQLEVGADFPPGTQFRLEGKAGFVNALVKGYFEEGPEGKVQLPLSPYRLNRFKEIPFPARSLNTLQLIARLPEIHEQRTYEIFARQCYKGEEVGRITWQVVPPMQEGPVPWLDRLREFIFQITPLSCLLILLSVLAILIMLFLIVGSLS